MGIRIQKIFPWRVFFQLGLKNVGSSEMLIDRVVYCTVVVSHRISQFCRFEVLACHSEFSSTFQTYFCLIFGEILMVIFFTESAGKFCFFV